MAKREECSSDKLSQEFLQCPLCYDLYEKPKVLPCQHTFCLSCLKSYVASREDHLQTPCPVCKQLANIPRNSVENFPNNFMIVSLRQFVEESKRKAVGAISPVKTSIPESHSSENATLESASSDSQLICQACRKTAGQCSSYCYCESCALWLCETCTRAHPVIPFTSTHSLISNESMDKLCKDMAGTAADAVLECQQVSNDKYEVLLAQMELLPQKLHPVRQKIEMCAAEAHRIIDGKVQDLTDKVERFYKNQEEDLSRKLKIVQERKDTLLKLQDQLNSIHLIQNGCANQRKMKNVQETLSSLPNLSDLPSNSEHIECLAFRTFSSSLSDLKSAEIGNLHITSPYSGPLFLQDHELRVHKSASLVEREYITGLAITRLAQKFVVANNHSVLVFTPDSCLPCPFLSTLTEPNVERPWGVAYSSTDKVVYITNAGRQEGAGSVLAYSCDGKFKLVLAAGLTLPRGIAIHDNHVFVCDQIDRCVYVFNKSGRLMKLLRKSQTGDFLFSGPMFIAVNKEGRFAVADSCQCVKVFDQDCSLLFTYTSNLEDSEFWDVHVLQNGTVVVCDWKHGLHKISSDFSSNGLISMQSSALKEPSALAALENGNAIYIGTHGGDIYSAI